MKDFLALLAHLLITIARLLGPGGAKAIVADSLLMKQQLLIINRSRKRAPSLKATDRLLFGFFSLFLNARSIQRAAVIIRPSTLLKLHNALKQPKYRLFFSLANKGRPGPKGTTQELIDAIVQMKKRNPRYGCPRIAEEINNTFGLEINKDVVRRVLEKVYQPTLDNNGPSWLTFLGHAKDSLWSIDLFRCESILMKTHWVLVVMDQHTRRIIGFGIQAGAVDGVNLCRMFNEVISTAGSPKYLSSDNDPLFNYHQWQANLRILDVEEIKSIPYTPISQPFVERLIGTIRREFLDQTLFWNADDLQRKLSLFKDYYNEHRTHSSLHGSTPREEPHKPTLNLSQFGWQKHCRGLFQLPITF